MTTTISDSTDTLTPQLIDGWESNREARTIVHQVLGSHEPAVTLRPSGLRAGTLRIVAGTSASLATQIEEMLISGKVLTVASTAAPMVNMTFVVSGEVSMSVDDTRKVWLLEAEFQEVS